MLNTGTRQQYAGSGLLMAGFALVVLVAQILMGRRLTEGYWIYTLDDAYIHLVMAKTLAQAGVWGIAPDAFAACSSSPLWTLLLAAGFKILGVRDWLPGVFNILFTLLALLAMDRIAARSGVRDRVRLLFGLTVFFLVPFTVIASTGMEHVLHVLLTILFLGAALRELEAPASSRLSALVLPLLVILMTAARYESLFVIAPFLLVLVLKRRWRAGLLLGGCALLPVLAHGLFSLQQGGLFLPNSLVLKGRIPGGGMVRYLFQAFAMYVDVTLENVHVHIVCILLLLTACHRRIPEPIRLLALVFVAASVGHVTFAQCGRFYRYEAYLMAAGFLLLAAAWLPAGRKWWRSSDSAQVAGASGWLLLARVGFLLFLLCPLFLRGVWATSRVPRGSANIFQQQWQLARIFKTLDLQGKAVGINDLGLMAERSGARIIDLWGLGTTEIAKAKWSGRYGPATIADLLARHDVGYVAVYDEWFSMGRDLPDSLILVARLIIGKNIVCAHDTVMLYATGPFEAAKLRGHLRQLPFSLPRETRVELVR
jgi:hypothetical protein